VTNGVISDLVTRANSVINTIPIDMAPIKLIEYFRVKPRWLFVKIADEDGLVGWGEGTLEGHTLAVEGALDEIIVRLIGQDAKCVPNQIVTRPSANLWKPH
jgi:L-alanine-DL-glutamate epimerase-like enolase superfamily enzyme